jgi:hypothetical protein
MDIVLLFSGRKKAAAAGKEYTLSLFQCRCRSFTAAFLLAKCFPKKKITPLPPLCPRNLFPNV